MSPAGAAVALYVGSVLGLASVFAASLLADLREARARQAEEKAAVDRAWERLLHQLEEEGRWRLKADRAEGNHHPLPKERTR